LPALAVEDPVDSGMTIFAKTVEVVGRVPSGKFVACDRCQHKVIGQWVAN